jgi:hypothetical protein
MVTKDEQKMITSNDLLIELSHILDALDADASAQVKVSDDDRWEIAIQVKNFGATS